MKTKTSIMLGITSNTARLEREKARAIEAIKSGDYTIAAMAVASAAICAGAIEELKFQMDALEIEGDGE